MKAIKAFNSILLALFGTFIEYYDYALYSFAAPIFAYTFFPKSDPTVALLQAYGIFIAGFCAKPLGSLIFSILGDKFGRAFVLKISITGIAIPTLIIGFTPDYSLIGWVAPALLLLARIFHGIFVSGESDNARVFIYEMLDRKNRYLSNSLIYFICLLGIYAASFNISYATSFASSEITVLGFRVSYWRLPFVIGGMFGIMLFYLRRCLIESTAFVKNRQKKNNHSPNSTHPYRTHPYRTHPCHTDYLNSITQTLLSFFKDINKRSLLATLLLTGTVGGQYHFYFVFLNQYLSQMLNHYDLASASKITSNLLLLFTLTLPVAGFVADKLTQRFEIISLLKISALIICATACTNILCIWAGILPVKVMVLTVLSLSFTHANTFIVILNQFKVSERCRGSSLGHSLGSMILSGSTPFVSLWIWKTTQLPMAPLFFFLFLCGLNFAALFLVKPRIADSRTVKQITEDNKTKTFVFN